MSANKPDLNELAKVYASSYASPHHITFTLDGLKNLIVEAVQVERPDIAAAKAALDDLDDFTRMAGIQAIGALQVLAEFIDSRAVQVEPKLEVPPWPTPYRREPTKEEPYVVSLFTAEQMLDYAGQAVASATAFYRALSTPLEATPYDLPEPGVCFESTDLCGETTYEYAYTAAQMFAIYQSGIGHEKCLAAVAVSEALQVEPQWFERTRHAQLLVAKEAVQLVKVNGTIEYKYILATLDSLVSAIEAGHIVRQ